MSMMLQISLGMIPAILFVLIMILINRKMLVRRIILLVLLAAVSISGVVLHLRNRPEPAEAEVAESVRSADLVYALIAQGDPEGAQELLDQMLQTTVYTPEYALCQARLDVMDGNYAAAKVLYQKAVSAGLGSDDVNAEYNAVCRSFAPDGMDISLLIHNPEYKAQTENADQIIQEVSKAQTQASELVKQAVATAVDNMDDMIVKAAENILLSDSIYQSYLQNSAYDLGQVNEIIKQMNTLQRKQPGLFAQPILRESRMKMYLVAGEFSALAKSIDENAGYKELMVVSELYINGYITEKDFSKIYGKENTELLKALLEHLKSLYKNEFQDESAAFRRRVKEFMESLEYAVNNPALSQMQKDLAKYAQQYNAVDGSKVYMQLANLSYYQGDEATADKHLASSFDSVGNCQDENYTDPMYAVIGAINDKDNPEELKNISGYVNEILENSTVIQMHETVLQPNPEQELPEGEEPRPGFHTQVTDFATQKYASVNIVKLDASNFSEVVMEICVDADLAYSAEELKNILQITDCGAQIEDFTIEEIKYDRINILLVCDVSGSMDGSPIESLRETVRRFVNSKTDTERIGLVTFSYGVESVYGLDSTVEELNAAIDDIYAGGGTAIYDAMCQSVTMIGGDQNAMNVILLLSDGQDNDYISQEDIQNNVAQPCRQRGIVIYPIGLGDGVDAEYLQYYGTGTGGQYLHVDDDKTLDRTYEFLRGLFSTRYRITYKAVDTMTSERIAKVTLNTDHLSYDQWQYTINGSVGENEKDVLENKTVTGLDTRVLIKSKAAQTVHLLVSGFEESDKVTVKLLGDLDYDIKSEWAGEGKYRLTIPSNVAVGVYDLQVDVNGATAYLPNELTVGIEESTTRFGSYNFTAYIKKTSGNTVTLSGNVCLNGWLYFDGAVTLTGDLKKDSSITMQDTEGCRVVYVNSNATGFAKYLAERDKDLCLPALGSVTLFDDDYIAGSTEDYAVDGFVLFKLPLSNMFMFNSPTMYLYPDCLKVELVDITTKFPFQEQILTSNDVFDIFNFDVESTLTVSNQTIGMYFNLELSPDSFDKGDNNSKSVKTGNMPLKIGMDEFALTIDTIKGDYAFKFKAELNFVRVKGLGLSLRWSDSFIPKEVRFFCDVELSTSFSGVPVTFSDFELAIADIDPDKSPFQWTYEGVTKISVAKVSAVMPGLDKYVGDASVMALDSATLSLRLGQRYIHLSADAKLFGEVKVGSILIECGHIPYTNALLKMQDEQIIGLRGKVTKGLFWDSSNCDIELSGSVEVTLSDKVIGATVTGTCDVEVDWWIFNKSVDIRGAAFLGIYRDHSDNYIFTVRASSRSVGGKRGINITWSKRHGGDVDTKYY